jgi:alpha-ketoglutarate-dependent taurine dioxygenase
VLPTKPLKQSFGTTVCAGTPGAALLGLDVEDVVRLYKARGAVHFRGFAVDVESFGRFTERFTAEFVVNGSLTREPVSEDGKTQTVNTGHEFLPLHSEMAYSPFRPDLLWFYCQTPARKGGETMLCDGAEAWAGLDQKTQAQFLADKVKYIFRGIPLRFAGQFVGQELSAASVAEKLRGIPGVRYHLHGDSKFDLEYVVLAVARPKHHGAPAFANSILGVESEHVTFDSGAPISRELRLGLFEVMANAAVLVKWQAGDVLMIDNRRVLHGRTPFAKDDRRRILIRMGRETFS